MENPVINIKLPDLPYDVQEALNQARINISFLGEDKKVLLISSSGPNEGKSFISTNLWKMMAEVGSKVLLIDGDLRNSVLRHDLNITGAAKMNGITEYLSGKCTLADAIYPTTVGKGDILPVITPIINPSILLETKRFANLFETARKQYDYVIVDTPPVQLVGDALAMAPFSDGSIVVVHAGVTPRNVIQNTLSSLKRTGKPVLGTILNQYISKNNNYGYYNRYMYYGYGYRYGYGRHRNS